MQQGSKDGRTKMEVNMTKTNEIIEDLKAMLKLGLSTRLSLDLMNSKPDIIKAFDELLEKSPLGGTQQHNEVLSWANDFLFACVANFVPGDMDCIAAEPGADFPSVTMDADFSKRMSK